MSKTRQIDKIQCAKTLIISLQQVSVNTLTLAFIFTNDILLLLLTKDFFFKKKKKNTTTLFVSFFLTAVQ